MKFSLRFGLGWRAFAWWTAGTVIALVGGAAVIQHGARVLLRSDAEHAAMQWARFARDSVPDLEQAFAGHGFTLEALRQLRRLRQADDVFRFRIYDLSGRELLASDDLDAPTPSGPLTQLRVDTRVRELLRSGTSRIELVRDGPAPHAVYSEAYVPVMRDGRALGAVAVSVDQQARAERIAASFREVAAGIATLLLVLVGVGLWQRWLRARAQQQLEGRLRYLAQHDVLTGLLNRSGFQDGLQHAQQRAADGGPAFAVLCINLDGFKDINATRGHQEGDALLAATAQRLCETVREIDLVARLAADEFGVLQVAVHGVGDVELLGQRIAAALAVPHEIGAHSVRLPGTLGAAVYGVDGADAQEVMHKAEQALSRAKAQRRGGFSFYDAAMDERLQARRALEADLRQALYDGDLFLHFQPLYEGDGRTLSGYEALVRWNHPRRGNVPPGEFIPLAEECGLIGDLGLWVLTRACDEAAGWPPSLSVSVNLSAAQFRDGAELARQVGVCLESSGLSAGRLELEITESLLMGNTEQVVQTLHALTDMGVRIAMDDFGTGYSSLAYLWRFPFDKVKIDRAFTHNLEQDPKVELIVRSIVSLAHSLNMRVNAEGVETAAQMQCLQAHGCDELQGFLLGKPMPATQLRHEGAPRVAEHRVPRARTDLAPLSTRPATLQ